MTEHIMTLNSINEILSDDYKLDNIRFYIEDINFSDRAFNELKENNVISQDDYIGKSIVYKTDQGDNLAISKYAIFDDVAYISWIWINKAIRSHGYGCKLVSQTIQQINKHNISEIYTLPKSDAANHIFTKKDFKPSKINGFVILEI